VLSRPFRRGAMFENGGNCPRRGLRYRGQKRGWPRRGITPGLSRYGLRDQRPRPIFFFWRRGRCRFGLTSALLLRTAPLEFMLPERPE